MPKDKELSAHEIQKLIVKKHREICDLKHKLSLMKKEERIKHTSPKFKEMFNVGEEKKEGYFKKADEETKKLKKQKKSEG